MGDEGFAARLEEAWGRILQRRKPERKIGHKHIYGWGPIDSEDLDEHLKFYNTERPSPGVSQHEEATDRHGQEVYPNSEKET